MWRAACLAPVLVALGGCAPEGRDLLVRQHTEDGVHLFQQGAYAGARDVFRTALNLRPDDPDLVYNLARCHHRLGQLDEAEKLYGKCLDLAPDHADARHAWILLLVNTSRQDKALALVQDWRRQRPQLAAPYVEEAWLLGRAGNLDDALVRYQAALSRDPCHPRALIEMAALYEKLGRPDRALVLYERSLAARPDQPAITRLVRDLRGRGIGRPHPD